MHRGTLRIGINDSQIEVTVTETGIVVKDEGVEDTRAQRADVNAPNRSRRRRPLGD